MLDRKFFVILVLQLGVIGMRSAELESNGEPLEMFYDDVDVPPRDNGCLIKPNVYYFIFAHNSKMIVGVKDDSRENFGAIVQRRPKITDLRHSSKWYFRNVDANNRSKYFYVINKFSGKYMQVANGSSGDGARFEQNAFTGKPNQQFRLDPDHLAYCRIVAAHSDKVLTSADDAIAQGAGLVQQTPQRQPGQRWRLEEVDCDPHPDQKYHIEDRDGESVLGLDPIDHRLLTLMIKNHGESKTKFQYVQVGRAFQGGKGDEDADDASSANMVLYRISTDQENNVLEGDGTGGVFVTSMNEKDDGSQHFYFARKAKHHACEIKNYKFDQKISADTATRKVEMSGTKNHKGTQWRLIPAGYDLEISPLVPYRIRNRKTGYYMDILKPAGSSSLGIFDLWSDQRQQFNFKPVQKQWQVYQIEVEGTGLVLDGGNEESIEQVRSLQLDPWQMFKLVHLWHEKKAGKNVQNVIIISMMREKALEPISEVGHNIKVVQRELDFNNTAQHWEILK